MLVSAREVGLYVFHSEGRSAVNEHRMNSGGARGRQNAPDRNRAVRCEKENWHEEEHGVNY